MSLFAKMKTRSRANRAISRIAKAQDVHADVWFANIVSLGVLVNVLCTARSHVRARNATQKVAMLASNFATILHTPCVQITIMSKMVTTHADTKKTALKILVK